MKKVKIISLILSITLFVVSSCDKSPQKPFADEIVGGLELLSSEQTGIDFSNTIKESKQFHHYYFSQMYLGSGVAIGDINNDGLPDIFFGGNQVADRLYLNKGDLKFDDITKSSKVAKNSGWTWGVTMVDINADGYLDIYVSRNGSSFNPEDRRNQLYINNQDLTFTESAIKYGLADIGFSTQAVFFDMDNDGDLDMYQLNQPPDKKLMLSREIPKSQYKFFLDRMYRNDNGKFKDISLQVGIDRRLAYGLSVNASDLNNDGWVDLYIANDYAMPDFMYYNNGDGTFRNVINEELKHITQLSMGSDIGDINNDGLLDLITTDMTPEDHYRAKTNMASMSTEVFEALFDAGGHRQYMTNTLQLNTGLGSFSDIANLAGTSSTDWSWSSLIADIDNDGWKDIIVSNGIKKDVDNNDYRNILSNLNPDSTTVDELYRMSKEAPSQPISNYAFRNKGNLEFEKVSKKWGFNTPSFSNGMSYGDLDNDGDLDVVVNNIDSEAFIYKNNATGNFLKIRLEGSEKNIFGYGTKAIISHNGKTQMSENFVTRGYLSSINPEFLFGLGLEKNIDKVEIIWPDGKTNTFLNVQANEMLIAHYSDSKAINKNTSKDETLLSKINAEDLGLDFIHDENKYDEFTEEILLPHNISQNGPFIAIGDVNGDQIEDLFIGGASGQVGVLYLQKQNGQFVKNLSQPWAIDKQSEDLGVLFLDVDGDNDLDLFISSGGSEFKQGDTRLKDRLYINDGKGQFLKDKQALPNIYESSQCVKSSDIDKDGDLDLFVGTRLISGKYTYPASSYFLINNNGTFKKASKDKAVVLDNIGMVTDAVFSDIDNDNDEDLIVVGEWMEIKLLLNNNGVFEDQSEVFGLKNTRGIWWSITAEDIDKDGDDDYIVGNLGKNNKFKASEEHPFKVYANDFDNNGTNDVVLAKFYKDDYVPLRGRECTSQQMPYVAKKFEDYNSFASSKLIDILPKEKVDDAIVYEITSFESIILVNENGSLIKNSLPNEAQISPIKASIVLDINEDGNLDIITVGNHYGVEVETTRYDAGFGTVLIGDGQNNFKFYSPQKSGLYIPEDSRDIKQLKTNNKKLIITTNNDKSLSIFNKNDKN
ncbi:Repeat domain-containing protein [Formosa sp. Hel1_31_208]|uniref:VCBS repeat-containing protein n=1 Tax=Formosa sp. Hel1_31_208 TaxID=1798225 RepID=UPI0008792007|nr:VCBS repeat-containing protein [Formosa sp. Hel1_31_208]SDS24106.1 Repeat domain-containing protein [Formosa sp. Hel1_31_208]